MIYLGIDSGTQSTKTIAVDITNGDVLASASQAYDLLPNLPVGHLEQNPRDWLDATRATIQQCVDQLGDRASEVRGIGVSGQQHGLVILDESGEVIRPAKLWCDTSTEEQCREFEEEFGGVQGLIRLAGNPVLPGYTAPKILWVKENEPENFDKIRTILLPHDYINYWLTGQATMEYGDASGTALMDVRERKWCEKLVNFLGGPVPDALPALQSSEQPAGRLKEDLAHELGLPAGIVVSSGGGDNMMGAIGTGNIEPGQVTVSLGTSGTLYAFSAKPAIDEHGEAAAFCDSTDNWLPLVCTMNVTVATEQVRKMYEWSHARMEEEITQVRPGSDNLLLLPYFNGERTPNLPRGCGVLHGLTTRNMTPAHIARATMEGVTLGLAFGLERFREMGITPREIRLTGGGSNSAVWRQMVADVFGLPAAGLATAEGAALGAAIQAAWADNQGDLHALTAHTVHLDDSTRVTPNQENHQLYQKDLQRQTRLTAKLHEAGYL
jgi:xylulokinase